MDSSPYGDLERPLVEELKVSTGSRNDTISVVNRVGLLLNGLTLACVIVFGLHNWSSSEGGASKSYDNAQCASICAPVCLNMVPTCYQKCYETCDQGQEGMTRPDPTGKGLEDFIMLNAIQHVGITTSNLTRSVEFYTKVLGGVEVIYAGGDGWKGTPSDPQSVYQLLMQQALLGGPSTAKWAANLSDGGGDVLNARYVTFGSLVIEFLDYTADEVKLQRQMLENPSGPPSMDQVRSQPPPSPPGVFPTFSDSNVAPSVAGNMHVSFNIRPDKKLVEFVRKFEENSHQLGYHNVWCNRLIPATHDQYNTAAVPAKYNAYFVKTGGFKGWSLAYCKGPDGEQLEFNQVVENAKVDFDQAQAQYVAGGQNDIW